MPGQTRPVYVLWWYWDLLGAGGSRWQIEHCGRTNPDLHEPCHSDVRDGYSERSCQELCVMRFDSASTCLFMWAARFWIEEPKKPVRTSLTVLPKKPPTTKSSRWPMNIDASQYSEPYWLLQRIYASAAFRTRYWATICIIVQGRTMMRWCSKASSNHQRTWQPRRSAWYFATALTE